ncbi:hypothetical protein STSP2_02967 [Anaerohalosphaera lusitana]|uniref:Prepilin-type N-terminal cleavage/methylation domain-containing protein n=1 Tax=Anaerohalosphaera lusitana TaxID=1936003 RepID=A0A1U9NQ78_9BACT|nr:hypothetical protein [Anaerohalosphaera lusitana]AQT69770.1 hypothetical protein STSP2_02967 [Anaerohalosphaera lusitana]
MYGRVRKTGRCRGGRRCRGGFTLTEVVVASTLLLLGITPILKALTGSYISSTRIDQKTQSLLLAEAKLDEVKDAVGADHAASVVQSDLQLQDGFYCDIADDTVNSGLRELSVSVGVDADSNARLDDDEVLVSLSTMVARRM